MKVTDDWGTVARLTATSVVPGNLSTANSEKTIAPEAEVRSLASLDPKSILQSFGKNWKGKFGFLSLTAKDKGLNCLDGLSKYTLIEELDLSYNALVDASAIAGLPSLLILNLANNCLRSIDTRAFRHSIAFLDLSNNQLDDFPDLSLFPSLQEVNLAANNLKSVTCSAESRALKRLNLSYNNIVGFEGCLDFPNLTHLKVTHAQLTSLDWVARFPRLQSLSVANNGVTSLQGIEGLGDLSELNVARNGLKDISEVYRLQELPYLKVLDLDDNPCQEINFYLYLMCHALPQLLWLDGERLTEQAKAETDIFFGQDLDRRKTIFEKHLPQETFVDSRLYRVENVIVHKDLLEDFSQQEIETYEFKLT